MSEKRTFEMNNGSDYIQLLKLLKIEQIAQTGGHGKLLIEDKQIIVNQRVETRKRRKLRKGDIVHFGSIKIEIV